MSEKETIIVIGAGVIGLSTAVCLQPHLSPNQSILIVARDWPGTLNLNYASPWAGAHYRPVPGSTAQAASEEQQARRTYQHFKAQAKIPGSGIEGTEGIEHLESPPADYLATDVFDKFYTHLDGFRKLSALEMPKDVTWGVRYDTFCVNPPVYIAYLLRRFILKGGQTKEYTLASPQEAFYLAPNVKTVINCSGVGFKDPKSYIIRGQTCLVRNPCPNTLTRQNSDGSWSFAVPRPLEGGTIIGGTKQPHDWDPRVHLEVREKLLREAAKWFPFTPESGGKFDVIRDIVGRRPAREGGTRIEAEKLGDGKTIVHGYGTAGRGYEISWGVAEDVVALVRGNGLVPERASL
ncbi:FAD-dependent oxidoreductase [Aspergillus lucknowensis]|uniref:FAD dependent oxidoreductase domain-containing protein n=1 Tax=Aspergillus lucknowensis TaxID=176173 RepID=A0ABR4LKK0_9EURO